MKKLIIFDLDGTLAESKQVLAPNMAETLCKLLAKVQVGVISGASINQFKNQFISHLSCAELFQNLHIMPTNGASYFLYDKENNDWEVKYVHEIKDDNKNRVRHALEQAIGESGVEIPTEIYGEQLEDRKTQMTWSALGQKAPLESKNIWDKDQLKRLKIKERLDILIPDFQIGVGGLTSIDITQKGIDKGFAIKELMNRLGLIKEEVLYVGDALFPGGNDYPAKGAGVDTLQVSGPDDTIEKMQQYIN